MSFQGILHREVGSVTWAGHTVTLAEYVFPCGTVAPYLEVSEEHPWYKGSRLLPVSEAVHALLNLGPMELFQVAERAADYQGTATVPREEG